MNLLDLVQAQLPDERLASLASLLGESVAGTRKALRGVALPALLAGLSGEYAGEAGAARLLELLRAGGHDGSILGNLDGALAGGAHSDALLNLGKGQLGAILGDRADAVAELMVADTGIRRSAAGDLLGLLVPLVLGVLARQLQGGGGGGGATRIAELLSGARPALAAVASPGLGAALGVADLSIPAAATAAKTARQGAVWPWLIVPAVTLAMFFSLRSCQQNSMQTQAEPAPAATSPVAAPTGAVPGDAAVPAVAPVTAVAPPPDVAPAPEDAPAPAGADVSPPAPPTP